MDYCGKTALVYGCGVSGIGAADLLGPGKARPP